jgi:hypothetical protein
MEMPGKRLYLMLEVAAILPIPMKQYQGKAFSFLYIVVGNIAPLHLPRGGEISI